MKNFGQLLLLTIAVPAMSQPVNDVDEYGEIGETCVQSTDPAACMESYGFQCEAYRRPEVTAAAYYLACNMTLSNGLQQYAQLLNDGMGWSVESQGTHNSDDDEYLAPADDADLALTDYIRQELNRHAVLSSGNKNADQFKNPFAYSTGMLRGDGNRKLRSLCGLVLDGPIDEINSAKLQKLCEEELLERIRLLSQSEATSPYIAAGAAELQWESNNVFIASGDAALIIEGRYTFAEGHKSCRLTNDCCLGDGLGYFESCRPVSEAEIESAMSCLAAGLKLQSEPYYDCLREADVKVGCEEQSDGSRVCY